MVQLSAKCAARTAAPRPWLIVMPNVGCVITVALVALLVGIAPPCVGQVSVQPAAPIDGASDPNQAFVTNLGRTVLSKATLVVAGTLGGSARRVGHLSHRELVIEHVLWGETKLRQLLVVYESHEGLDDLGQKVALALKPASDSGSTWRMAARPMSLADHQRLDAVRSYCRLELSTAAFGDRAEALLDLIYDHLRLGGEPARFAAVELIYLVLHHPRLFGHDDYGLLQGLATAAAPGVRRDITIALRGMVELILKPDAQVEILVFEDDVLRRDALQRLNLYLRQHPDAFAEKDATRCALIAGNSSPEFLEQLATHRDLVMAIVEDRKAASAGIAGSTSWLRREIERREAREHAANTPSDQSGTVPRPFTVE